MNQFMLILYINWKQEFCQYFQISNIALEISLKFCQKWQNISFRKGIFF